MKTTYIRIAFTLLALCLVLLSFQVPPAEAATNKCCLDDWGAGVCPVGYKRYAVCTGGCEVCGAFSCVPKSTPCLR